LVAAPAREAATNPVPSWRDVEATLKQAEQADRAGRRKEAVQLYARAASDGLAVDHPRAPEAFQRAYYLLYPERTASAQPAPAAPTFASPARPDSRFSPLRGEAASAVAPPAAPAPPAAAAAAPAPPAAMPSPQRYQSGPGWLYRSGRNLEGRPTYLLQRAGGTNLLYVTPGPGVSLEPFVNKSVQLFGPTEYRGDLRAWLMTVSDVQAMP
jgi:hypothetical protein